MSNIGNQAEFADELSIAASTFTGVYQLVGSLLFNPVHLILDNQTSVSVQFSNNGTSTKKTLASGQAVIFDMRGNRGMASNFTFSIGMPLYVLASAGTGSFRISYTYAVN